MKTRKYNLVGIDGNAHSVMGYVCDAMRNEHIPESEIDRYLDEAMSSNYQHLLEVSVMVVEVCNVLKSGVKVDWNKQRIKY